MTWGRFLIGYLVSLIVAIGSAVWLEMRFGFPRYRTILLIGALFFAWAALGRPRYIYLLVRNIGWFSAIEGDRSMRTTLWVLAAVLLLIALAG
jgi:hypothetical protein